MTKCVVYHVFDCLLVFIIVSNFNVTKHNVKYFTVILGDVRTQMH